MKCVFLVVLLAAAATAAVVTNDVLDRDEVVLVDLNEVPDVVDEQVIEANLSDEAEETVVASRSSLSQGTIGSSDVLEYNNEHRVFGVSGEIIQRDIPISTTRNRQITAIRVSRLGTTQNANPSILRGGLRQTFVTIRIRSAVGRGFNYSIQVYAR